jgi:hypothetical protein
VVQQALHQRFDLERVLARSGSREPMPMELETGAAYIASSTEGMEEPSPMPPPPSSVTMRTTNAVCDGSQTALTFGRRRGWCQRRYYASLLPVANDRVDKGAGTRVFRRGEEAPGSAIFTIWPASIMTTRSATSRA